MHTLYTISALSFDSFLACIIIGCCSSFGRGRSPGGRTRWQIAAAFGFCDFAAAIAGSHWPPAFPEPSAAALYLSCAALLTCAVAGRRRPLIYALPVILSIDNLFCGIPAEQAPAFGFVSAAMALTGFGAAALVRSRLPPSNARSMRPVQSGGLLKAPS